MDGDQFYVTLSSAASSELYKSNTLTDFTTLLAKPIDIDERNYEVALCECQIHAYIENVREKHAAFTIAFRDLPDLSGIFNLNKTPKAKRIRAQLIEKTITIHIEPGYYTDLAQVFLSFNKTFRNIDLCKDMLFIVPENKGAITKATLVSKAGVNLAEKARFTLRLEPWLNSLARVVATDKNGLKFEGPTYLPKPIHPGPAMIYSDIITHQYVGDVQARLFRVVDIPKESRSTTLTFANPYYLQLSEGLMSTIRMFIRDVQGKPYSLAPGTLTYTLHFKRKLM